MAATQSTMNATFTLVLLSVVIAASLWPGTAAQSSSGCNNVIISLSPCLNYITGNSSTPSSSCCSQLSNVVKLQPQCLCQVLNGGSSTSSLGITINQTQAMALPAACKVQTPSVTLCNNAASPANSPSESQTPAVPSGTSDTVPTGGDGSSSDGISIKLSLPFFSMLLFTAAYALTPSI